MQSRLLQAWSCLMLFIQAVQCPCIVALLSMSILHFETTMFNWCQ